MKKNRNTHAVQYNSAGEKRKCRGSERARNLAANRADRGGKRSAEKTEILSKFAGCNSGEFTPPPPLHLQFAASIAVHGAHTHAQRADSRLFKMPGLVMRVRKHRGM
jgi:hypothetical protein